ncbi:hypothetical protein [Actinophytocola oryzae]|uniref:Uncharacterized protein n=1 Tax=Actinophytocola oryzae TaxID=502181 RepID=A0A4R7UVN7_9PSEU|nr:hypothetical protein [Actinophytocola oryzae]TDV40012.1 hypothetical protein CLV71_12429 [Actinophytocola oryzae]
MSEDIKDLLGRAFGQEPPLGIDRDEVLEQGRKRLRRRRLFEAGGVVAAVVVAAVGAATLTNLSGSEPDRMPPAASSTQSAPPGPQLPMSPSETPEVPRTAVTTTEGPPPSAPVEGMVDKLTQQLYASGIVPEESLRASSDKSEAPRFRAVGETYVFETDLVLPTRQGYLRVVVERAGASTLTCGDAPRPFLNCTVWHLAPNDVVVSHVRAADGERRTNAMTISPHGFRLSATATNITAVDRAGGVSPTDDPPVLSDDEICMLLTKVGGSG